MKDKKTFVSYADWIDYFDEDTTMEQKGQIFDCILRFQNDETGVRPADPAARMVFNKIRATMKADAEKYEEKCRKRAEAAEARWRMQNDANASKCIQMHPDTDTDTDTETDTESPTETVREKAATQPKREPPKRFRPPTLEEVEAYCMERNNRVDAARFIDYYTSNGWKVGKNPMKDWKAAVRSWERREDHRDNVVPMTTAQKASAAQNDVLKAVYQGLL